MRKFMKKAALIMAAGLMLTAFTGCGAEKKAEEAKEVVEEKAEEVKEEVKEDAAEKTDVKVFIAASLGKAMDEVKAQYEEQHPNVNIIYNKDSSGKLMTQIKDGGAACDIFFSAAQGKMDTLEEADLIVNESRKNLVGNTLILIAGKDAKTEVTGLDTLSKAKSMALADGSVPVGKYTRKALLKAGILTSDKENPKEITTQEVRDALGGEIEISECSKVTEVLSAVIEEASEVGTVYYSGTYGVLDEIKVIEEVSHDLTGDIVYPVALIKNDEASDIETAAAKEFIDYLSSDEAKNIFDEFKFDTDVE